MHSITLDLDETIDQVKEISDSLLLHYPSWTEVARTQLAAQVLQTALLKASLACLVDLDDKV